MKWRAWTIRAAGIGGKSNGGRAMVRQVVRLEFVRLMLKTRRESLFVRVGIKANWPGVPIEARDWPGLIYWF